MNKSLSTSTSTTTVDDKKEQHANQTFDISVFSGLRVLASFIVVYGHVFFFPSAMLSKPTNVLLSPATQASEQILTVLSLLSIAFKNYSVDVFFFMSGYLFGSTFFSSSSAKKDSEKKQLNAHQQQQQRCSVGNIVYYMTSRLLRLLPMYGIAWAIGIFRGMPACRRFPQILYEVLGFLNFHPSFGEKPIADVTCLLVSWSLSTDMQAHIILCFLLLLTRARPRLTAMLVSALVLLQVYLRARFVFRLDHALLVNETGFDASGRDPTVAANFGSALGLPVSPDLSPVSSPQEILNVRRLVNDSVMYFGPGFRTGPALIGFLTWLVVTHELPPVHWIAKHRVLCIFLSATGSLFAIMCVLPVVFLHGEPRGLVSLWEGGNRAFYALCIGLFVISMGSVNCHNPKVGGGEKFLSYVKKMFVNTITTRLAPLSYAVYLLHMYTLWVATSVAPRVTPETYTVKRFAVSAVQVYVAASVVAVPCHWLEKACSAWLRRKILGRTGGEGGGKKTTEGVEQTKKTT